MIQLAEPESVGLCSDRLARLHMHLQRYVDAKKYPGYLVLVARHGKPVYCQCYGHMDVEAGKPVQEETIFRIYSMSKPITSVALMTLYEKGMFQLDDAVSRYIPAFKNLQVFSGGDAVRFDTVAPEREMTIRDLLTHTSGLTYGFMEAHPVDAMYRDQNVAGSANLDEMIRRLADIPLLFSPGSRWSYSMATDVLGYLVQKLADMPFADYLGRTIFNPLDMTDTAFYVPDEKIERFAACYDYHNGGYRLQDSPMQSPYRRPPGLCSGGGGLVSTAEDYFKFTRMLLGKGASNRVRILGRKTVEYMTTNHLPGHTDLVGMGQAVFSETPYYGIGFGLGFSVLLDPAASQVLGSPGEYAWGGMASTAFWIDPVEAMNVIFMTQLRPSSSHPVRRELRVLTYQAIID